MLYLGDAELELFPLGTRDEAELAQRAVQRLPRALAHADRVAAPAGRRVVDPAADFVLVQSPLLGERLGQLVRTLRGQRHGAEDGERELSNALVHADERDAVAVCAPASPARRTSQPLSPAPRRPRSAP